MPKQVSVLIADDHSLIRLGFKTLLDMEPDLSICGEAEGVDDALRLADELSPDVAVVDLSLGDGSGLDLVRRLHAHHPEMRILVCSMHDESLFASRVLKAGAHGFINKREAAAHVVEAIRRVLAGDVYLSTVMTQQMLRGVCDDVPGSVDALTDRELEVFSMIGKGYETKRIAKQLHLSVKTIETHREKIKRKLNLSSSCDLARHAAQWSLENAE